MNTKEKIIQSFENEDIHKECYCDKCNKMIPRQFRFTDWCDDRNDVFGDFDCCLNWFNKAVKDEPKGKFSIWAVTICEDCDSMLEDDGVLFNENCEEYS